MTSTLVFCIPVAAANRGGSEVPQVLNTILLPTARVVLLARSATHFRVRVYVSSYLKAFCTNSIAGTYVAVYGTIPGYFDTIPGAGATSRYFLDNLTVPYNTFTAQPEINTTYQQLFFSSDTLSQGTHSLTVTLAEDTVVDDSPGYWVDLLVVIPGSNTTSASNSTTRSLLPPSTPTSTSTSSDVTTTVTVTQGPHGGSSVPTGAIVGAILGGVIMLIGLIWLIYLLRRQCRRNLPNSIENGKCWLFPTVSPFNI